MLPDDDPTLGIGCNNISINFFKTGPRIFSVDNNAAYLLSDKLIGEIHPHTCQEFHDVSGFKPCFLSEYEEQSKTAFRKNHYPGCTCSEVQSLSKYLLREGMQWPQLQE